MAATTTAVAVERSAPGSTVVLLSPSLDYGGAEVMIAGLARALRASGWQVWVVSMLEPRAFVAELEQAGVHVVSLGMQAGHTNASGIARLVRLLSQVRPDVIHAHMFHANILARLLRPLLRIPVICTVHNILESSRRKNTAQFRNLLYRLTDWSCDRTTAVAEAVRSRYVRDGLARAERMETIPNGVDPECFHFDASARTAGREELGWADCFGWLAVGRLELAKDYPTMLRAVAHLNRSDPGVRLAIAGDGRLRSELQQLASSLGLDGVVQFLGTRTDVRQLMQASDAFVMSSAWEGAPMVLLEAAASALPVVATNAGGSAELVASGSSGWVVESGDVNALAERMAAVMHAGKEGRQRMGRAGRALVDANYSNAIIFERYERLYREVAQCSA
jgi:glycosyltransferase involved in cell wall biosynthesis